jgi:two-component system chemotaxis sensor kinase CheA
VLRAALGNEFLTRGRQAHVSADLIEAIRGQAAGLARSTTAEEVERLNRLVARLGAVRLRDTLAGFNRVIGDVAAKLGKEVAPLALAGGEEVWLDPTIFGPFLRSLVHVFRNAVVHGIERPEQREALGKARPGQVKCRIESDGTTLELSIADDGAGMDLGALREQAGRLGLFPDRDAETVAEEELYEALFRIGVSTYGTADDLAGRGVGLAALRSEVDGLGGAIRMQSAPNRGTECRISIPLVPIPRNSARTPA